MGYNSVDYLVLAIFAISILAGLMRGFVKEAISLATWFVAGYIAATFASPLAAMFSGSVQTSAQSVVGSNVNVATGINVMALGISFVALFLGTMLAGSIINYMVSGVFNAGGLGILNRLLGGAFGAVRGYIIVILFMFLAELTPMGAQTAWTQSQFVNSFAPTVTWFGNVVQPGLLYIKTNGAAAISNIAGQGQQTLTGAISNFGK
jgi:membrane protein required for colicin V production